MLLNFIFIYLFIYYLNMFVLACKETYIKLYLPLADWCKQH